MKDGSSAGKIRAGKQPPHRSELKKPTVLFFGVPTSSARSSRVLNSSQEVSGINIHAWHAAMLHASERVATPSMQRGSDEHHCMALMAPGRIGPIRSAV